MKPKTNWQINLLGEWANIERGRFSHRPRNDPSFFGGDIPFMQTGDVSGAQFGTIHHYSQTLNARGLAVSKLFPNLKFPAFATIEVTIPVDIKKQQRIADILDTCDQELLLLGAKRDALDQQKRGLMQKLLTGAIRVRTEKHG
ncbi:MAG: restriction endonuclease subunit S [bacterium]